jgi:hypothetical protein
MIIIKNSWVIINTQLRITLPLKQGSQEWDKGRGIQVEASVLIAF